MEEVHGKISSSKFGWDSDVARNTFAQAILSAREEWTAGISTSVKTDSKNGKGGQSYSANQRALVTALKSSLAENVRTKPSSKEDIETLVIPALANGLNNSIFTQQISIDITEALVHIPSKHKVPKGSDAFKPTVWKQNSGKKILVTPNTAKDDIQKILRVLIDVIEFCQPIEWSTKDGVYDHKTMLADRAAIVNQAIDLINGARS